MGKNKCICFAYSSLMNFTLHGKKNGKFFNAEQAKYVNHFKNIKEGLYKTKASIWYKKICRQQQLTPNYISIKVNTLIINVLTQ
jgi:hypothetical protein